MSIIFALKYNNKLKKNEIYRKRGKPRNILQKYVLKSQMNSLTRNYGVCDADRVP